MRKIKKSTSYSHRVFAAVLTAALLFTMPGMASYAEAEGAQTEDISESVAVLAEYDAAEKPEAETEVIQEPAEEETVPAQKEDAETCTCGTLCTQDSINGDCPVCGAEDADISCCVGEKTENRFEENKGDAKQGDTGAQDTGTNLCAHHEEHTKDCGYSPASEDGEGSQRLGLCTYECRICPIEDMIAALPRWVTEDNRAEVEAQLQEILSLYAELDAEEQEQIDISRCLELQAALDAANMPLPVADDTFTLDGNLTIHSGNLSSYDNRTLTGTTNGSNRSLTISGVTVHLTIQDLSLTIPHGTNSSDLIPGINLANNATLYLTLKGENTIKGGNMHPAIQVPAGCKLIITEDSTGSLAANAGIGAAGIGSPWGGNTDTSIMTLGSIEIKGGSISAVGSNGGAGIGGTQRGFTGSITITGGTVYAEGSRAIEVGSGMSQNTAGAGIGGGNMGYVPNITITGGDVTAKAGYETASCIGAGTDGGRNENGEYIYHSGEISITGGTVKTEGKFALGHNVNGAEGPITLSEAATLDMPGEIRPMPEGWESYTFSGRVFDTAITGTQTAASFSMDGKTYNVTIAKDTDQPYSGNLTFKTVMPIVESKEVRLVCGGNSYVGTIKRSGSTFSFTFGQQKYAYYSLNCRIYDEAVTANMDAQVTIEGVTTSAALMKTAEYRGDIQVNQMILPIEAKNRSSAVTVTAGGHTWIGTSSNGTAKTLTIGFPIQPAAMVLNLYYGDITFEKAGDNVQVKYTKPGETEASTALLTDLSKVYEITQSNADTPTTHRLIIKNTTEPVHIRIRNINIDTGTDSPIQITSGKVFLETAGTNTVTATGESTAAVYVGSGSALTLTGMGTLTAKSTNSSYSGAGIGTGKYESSGEITIQSGTIIAESVRRAAGIGGGKYSDGTVTITGGTVTATCVGNGGAGIGGGYEGSGTVVITGGTVTAACVGQGGAGIGGGGGEDGHGTVTITGGTVTATSGINSSGIGGGYGGGATVTITGGIITANGAGAGCGIGSGCDASADISITGGTIKASTGGTGAFIGSGIGSGDGSGTSKVAITGGTIQASGSKAVVENPKDGSSGDLGLVTITLDGADDQVLVTSVSDVGNYGLNDVYTRDGGKLYFYLPTGTLPAKITAGGVDYVPDEDGSHNYVVDLIFAFKDYSLTRVYDGKPLETPAENQVESNSAFGDLNFAWYQDDQQLANPPANAGNYALRVSSDKGSKEFDVSITKRPLTITAETQAIDYNTGIAQEKYTQSGLAEGDSLTVSLATDKTTTGTYTGGITISSAQITRDGVDVAGNYEVTYTSGDLTIRKIASVVSNWPTAAAITYGQALNESSLTGGDTSGTFAWKDASVKPDRAGQYSYDVIFTPADSNYETITQAVSVTVNKATPDIGAVTAEEMNDTLDVSQVVLSRVNQTPDGTLALTDSALKYGTNTYAWKFTPDDIVNYVPVTGTVQITINDTIAPAADYQIGTDDWKKFVNMVSFGLFCKDYKTVTIRGTDDTDTVTGSGIALTQYYISDQEMTDTDNIAWNTYTGPVSLDAQGAYIVYVKVTDNVGNTAILNSEGIVIYAESVLSPTAFNYTYKQNQDCTVQLTMNGNTFKELTDQEGNVIGTDNYAIDSNGALILKAAYLDTLDKGGYTYQVSMNPQGVESDQVTLVYSFTVNVKAKELTVTGAAATERAYNGANTVEVTAVTISGVVPGDDVAVDLSGVQGTLSSANAGTYTSVTLPELTLTGADKGNYTLVQPTGAVAASVTITPLDAEITVGTATYNKTFGDAAFTLDVMDNNTEADMQYEVTAGADVISVSNGTVTIRNAGTATITVSLPETANYNAAASKTITVTVAKKGGYTVTEQNRSYLYSRENTGSIDLAALLPKDCGTVTYGTPAASGDVTYIAAPAVNDGKLSYTLNSGNKNDEGTITVTVATRNYTDITITVKVKLTDRIPVSLKTGTEVTLKDNVLTYGEPLSRLVFDEAEFVGDDGNTVAGTLAWKDAAATPNAGTTSAVWVFIPADTAYISVEGAAAITVNRAAPTVTETLAVADRVYNPSIALKDSDLSGVTVTGVDGEALEGKWSWESANIVPTVNNSGYEAVFTPEDTTNYETVTRTITVNVTKATPYIAELPAAAAITYGETLKDSLLSGGTVQYGSGTGQAGEGAGAGSTETVAGAFTWKEPSTKPVVADSNVTEYTIVFTPSDTVNYNPVEAKVRLTVNKAQNAPNMPDSGITEPVQPQGTERADGNSTAAEKSPKTGQEHIVTYIIALIAVAIAEIAVFVWWKKEEKEGDGDCPGE